MKKVLLLFLLFFTIPARQFNNCQQTILHEITQDSSNSGSLNYLEQTINESNNLQEIKILYPRFNIKNLELNDTIEKDILHEMNQHLLLEYPKDSSTTLPWTFSVSYKVHYCSIKFISLILEFDCYSGGAHGNRYYKTYNYDLENKKFLELTDFIPTKNMLNRLCSLSENIISKLIKEPNKIAPDYDFFKNITFSCDSINVQFDEYQVCCYAEGAPCITIKLKDLLKNE